MTAYVVFVRESVTDAWAPSATAAMTSVKSI